ncbi:hypothetical protein JL100_005120 [Skermanella mucosa]|uniref:hypothetical protein n=1 Tax=Skermanella mucosa TaxID=1789672 RepID=UPI00192BE67B|nr:hypothetical protein [Skermanella mucosa]UEM22135.1 hypothetical protein JL100_005120 [Skermanella mucosa]
MLRVLTPLAVCLPLVLGAPAWAQVIVPPIMDQVVLDLTAEDWVGTDTARVEIVADAAAAGAAGSGSGGQRDDLLKAVSGLVPDAEWRITRFDRSTDQAGLERRRAVVEARLPESALGGLADKARQASRPGLQLRIGAIEFTPTLAETEAVRARLRAEIYGKAAAELEALERSFPGRSFRMGNIDFAEAPVPYARKTREAGPAMAMAAPMADGVPEDSPMNVSEKLVIRARVVLSAVAPRE